MQCEVNTVVEGFDDRTHTNGKIPFFNILAS